MLQNIKIKNTTKCECDREFIINDIKKLEKVNDKSFYSGVVKHYSKAICPKCGKEVILLLKQVGQTYKVLNIAEEIKENDKRIEIHQPEETTMANKETKTESNKLICPICKKECKSKSGMAAHMRAHETN